MSRYTNRINNRVSRLAFFGATGVFGYMMLEEYISPFIPIAIAVISGLIIGFIFRALFKHLVNRKLNSTYRYTEQKERPNKQKENIRKNTENANTKYANTEHIEKPAPYTDSLSMYRSLLGLGQNFTAGELKTAYHNKAAIYHPDRYAASSQKERENAEILMKQVNEAYEQLKTVAI